jgi:hypothetical protein
MPMFHFEIVDGHTIEDPKGMELPTEQQARRSLKRWPSRSQATWTMSSSRKLW